VSATRENNHDLLRMTLSAVIGGGVTYVAVAHAPSGIVLRSLLVVIVLACGSLALSPFVRIWRRQRPSR
jgi:hypothetical protein